MALPKWLKGGETPQERGRKFEKRQAKRCGVRPQPGSGNTPHYKEDFQSGEYLVQVKTTGGKQHSIKKDDLISLKVNSAKAGKYPAYLFDIDGETWLAVPVDSDTYKELAG